MEYLKKFSEAVVVAKKNKGALEKVMSLMMSECHNIENQYKTITDLCTELSRRQIEIDSEDKRLEIRFNELDSKERILEGREKDVDLREKQLHAREREADEKEKIFTRLSEIDSEAKQLAIRFSELDSKERNVEERVKEIESREELLDAKEHRADENLRRRQREIDSEAERLIGFLCELDSKKKTLEEREREIDSREKQLDAREHELDGKEEICSRRQGEIDSEAKKLTLRFSELDSREREADGKEIILSRRQSELHSKEMFLKGRENEFGAKEKNLSRREKELDIKEMTLGSRNTDVESRVRVLEQRETSIHLKLEKIEGKKLELFKQVEELVNLVKEPGLKEQLSQSHSDSLSNLASTSTGLDHPSSFDFDTGELGRSVDIGDVWACFDPKSELPRLYARVIRIFAKDGKDWLEVAWLKPHPVYDGEKEWIDAGLPVTCGKFDCSGVSIVSPKILCYPVESPRMILPCEGETWAIYKDWDILKWSCDPKIHQNCKYELVLILPRDSSSPGIKVAYLEKIKGDMFQRTSFDRYSILMMTNLYRFSHRVPHVKSVWFDAHGCCDRFKVDQRFLPEVLL